MSAANIFLRQQKRKRAPPTPELSDILCPGRHSAPADFFRTAVSSSRVIFCLQHPRNSRKTDSTNHFPHTRMLTPAVLRTKNIQKRPRQRPASTHFLHQIFIATRSLQYSAVASSRSAAGVRTERKSEYAFRNAPLPRQRTKKGEGSFPLCLRPLFLSVSCRIESGPMFLFAVLTSIHRGNGRVHAGTGPPERLRA